MAESEDRCASEGCGHPVASHVRDHVMHEGRWHDVARCLDCERDGGPCTDTHAIVDIEAAEPDGLEGIDLEKGA